MVDIFSMIFYIIGTIFLLSLGSGLPGLAAVRVLDPTADRWRTALLAPALGLLLMYGLFGWSVIFLGFYSNLAILFLIIIVNIVAIRILEKKPQGLRRKISNWQRLEMAMQSDSTSVQRGELGDELEDDTEGASIDNSNNWADEFAEYNGFGKDIWSEVVEQKEVRQSRPNWWWAPVSVAVFISILPLFLFKYPHGVDWIGFATLTHRFAEVGQFTLPSPSQGYWTYPPAFPAVAAFCEQSLGIGPDVAVHILGRISLLVLLLGIAGVSDRWGSGVQTLIAMGLAAGIFAKSFDSGWPTVSSQLGLVLGLLVVLRPAVKQRKEHNIAFGAGVLSVAVIHPTGAIYLGTLLFANLLMRHLNGRDDERGIAVAAISGTLLALATAATFLLFAPRLLQMDIFAEYGWQGGWPMLMYSSPLLLIAIWAGWKLRQTLEGSILIMWLMLQWALTLVHLLVGWTIPVLSLLSYTLYSMGLHGFHVPAAILCGMALAKGVKLTQLPKKIRLFEDNSKSSESAESSEGGPEEGPEEHSRLEDTFSGINDDTSVDEYIRSFEIVESKRASLVVFSIAILLVSCSQIAILNLSNHPELFATTDGDRAIVAELASYVGEGEVVYVENAHWGYAFDADGDILVSTHPEIGLIHLQESIQSVATSAIRHGDIDALRDLNISYAITSPMGGLSWTLSPSPWWTIELEIEGARLWKLADNLIPESEGWISSPSEESCEESPNCQLRKDPWDGHRHWDDPVIPDKRSFISEGEMSWESEIPANLRDRTVSSTALLEGASGIVVRVTLSSGDWTSSQVVDLNGWTMVKIPSGTPNDENMTVNIEIISGSGGIWINPLGLSGRSDRIIDSDGIYIHWLEVRPI